MANPAEADPPEDFATAFGDALNEFLLASGMRQVDLVELFGWQKKTGKSRINSYCRGSKQGRRVSPDAEILCLACTKLPGFSFIYRGHRISAETLSGNGRKPLKPPAEQLTFEFSRQFNLTRKQGTLAVKVSRPSGRIEVAVSLNARAS